MKIHKTSSTIVIGIVVLVGITASVLFLSRHWLQRQQYEYQVRTTLTGEVRKLDPTLAAMGFTKLKGPQTTCSTAENVAISGPTNEQGLQCTAAMSAYATVDTGAGKLKNLNRNAVVLSELLIKNGWEQSKYYPTIAWFQKISQGADYQPDQLNTKHLGNITCTVDFFTAFSRPNPPAITFDAQCYKPHQRIVELD